MPPHPSGSAGAEAYRKLAEEDKANEEKFEALDDRAEEAYEEMRGDLPEECEELMDLLEELENSYVIEAGISDGEIELKLEGWDDDGEEAIFTLRFDEAEVLENEGIEAHAEKDEDGDIESDCELLYSEIYIEDGRPEIHMLFDNNELKYLTFRCAEAHVYRSAAE